MTTPVSSELGQFIPLHYHYNMLNDRARMESFRAALNHVVHPGAKVLELGGGTGVLSFFAARHAAKVWCVEKNPALAQEARRILDLNPHGDKIEVVLADAFDYLPPEPVDIVICEMIHVAMLREKQIPVIAAFKERYLQRFGPPLPVFVPEALVQAFQPIQHPFTFSGYFAPTILFQDPEATHDDTVPLSTPIVYQTLAYDETLPTRCEWQGTLTFDRASDFNALRFITKNVLAILPDEGRTIDWFSQYLIVPLAQPVTIGTERQLQLAFSYHPGDPLEALRPLISEA